jgi:hypothetical protein
MPEKSFHKIPSPKSTFETVFIGIGQVAKEIPKAQEQAVLKIINNHIIPHLPKEVQEKAKANKTRIELFAKRAGVAMTVAEITTAVIIGMKFIQKFKKPQIQEVLSMPPIPTKTPHIEINSTVDPYTTPAEEAQKMITRPVKKIVREVRETIQLTNEKKKVRDFIPETLPVSMEAAQQMSTKVFCQSGGATDFASSPLHFLFFGSDQRDFSIASSEVHSIATMNPKIPPHPMIHMNPRGEIGNAIHLAESSFVSGRTNRPFWHSFHRTPDYDVFIRAMERNLPVIDASLRGSIPLLADTQQHAMEIADMLNKGNTYPWVYRGQGFDASKTSHDANNAAIKWLATLPKQDIQFHIGKGLWDTSMLDLKNTSLPTLAALLDKMLDITKLRSSKPSIFVPSTSFDLVEPGLEPHNDALVMQAFYALFMPLLRKERGVSPTEPFTVTLPGFSTSPVLERSIRFFLPSEKSVVDHYGSRSEILNVKTLTSRGQLFLDLLKGMNSFDRLKDINFWRKQILGNNIPT